jgi:hypothetical protein
MLSRRILVQARPTSMLVPHCLSHQDPRCGRLLLSVHGTLWLQSVMGRDYAPQLKLKV